MKKFLEKLVSFIVSEETPFEIKEEVIDNLTTYIILVPETEIGKVIGKEGKVISALRILTRIKAVKEQKQVLIKVDKLVQS